MVRLPVQLSPAQQSMLASYREALAQRSLALLDDPEELASMRQDFAFAMGVSCGLELSRLAPFCPSQLVEVDHE